MKTKKFATKFVAWLLWFAIFATQASAGLNFWWGWWSVETFILQNSTQLEWWNDKLIKFKEKYEEKIKKQLKKWWVTTAKVKTFWSKIIYYTPDTDLNDWTLIWSPDKIVLRWTKDWSIEIYAPTNAEFKEKFQFSYIIPWVSSSYYTLWDSNWKKVFANMYNPTNAWRSVVFTVKDWYWNSTYITSKLWESSVDLETIAWNKILDYYESMDDWITSKEAWILQVTKTLTDLNSDWKVTCTWVPNDTHCTPDAWEKIEYTFKSLNTVWTDVKIMDFSNSIYWVNATWFKIINDTCSWLTELQPQWSCKIEYAVNNSNSFTMNQDLSAKLNLNATAIIQFEWNDYNKTVDLPLEWEVTWFCNYVAPTTDWSYACAWSEWFEIADYSKLDYSKLDYSKIGDWYWYAAIDDNTKMTWCTESNRYVFSEQSKNVVTVAWCDLKNTAYDNWTPSNNQYYYTRDNAMQACPTWWHLPSLAEWRLVADTLVANNTLDDTYPYSWYTSWSNSGEEAADASAWKNTLRRAYHTLLNWSNDNSAINLPGYNTGTDQGTGGFYWSSTEYSSSNARNLYLYSSNGVYWNNNSKTNGYSVRCLQK